MTRILTVLAVVGSAAAQAPLVGDINLYGLHKLTPAQILSAIPVKTGATLPPSKGELEDTLAKIPGVAAAHVDAVCCDGPRVTLFIGIQEEGAAHPEFRSEPAGDATLPAELVDAYRQFVALMARAAGHPVSAVPEAHALEEQFIAFATARLDTLRSVLRTASEPEQRAAAAAVIEYAPARQEIVDDLEYGLLDPDESVRANAARSLTAIGVLGGKQAALEIRIAPAPLVQLLDSAVLSDRMESAKALLTLTDRPNPAALQQLREQALPALAEMARWKTPQDAMPAFLLLGRVAGLPDAQVRQAFDKGDRETVIGKALAGR